MLDDSWLDSSSSFFSVVGTLFALSSNRSEELELELNEAESSDGLDETDGEDGDEDDEDDEDEDEGNK